MQPVRAVEVAQADALHLGRSLAPIDGLIFAGHEWRDRDREHDQHVCHHRNAVQKKMNRITSRITTSDMMMSSIVVMAGAIHTFGLRQGNDRKRAVYVSNRAAVQIKAHSETRAGRRGIGRRQIAYE